MSADDHLSPQQFGFHPADDGDWKKAMLSWDGKGQPGRISPDAELHTGQPGIFPDRVEEYVNKPGLASHTGKYLPVEVYHHEGKMYLGEGHHRVSAARIRGNKSIRVMHYGRET